MARILVTGVSGFVGKHLTRELADRDNEVIGVGLQSKADPSIEALLSEYVACDLADPAQVQEIPLDDVQSVISLAGLAQVGASFKDPQLYQRLNVAVLSVLSERILKEKRPIKVLAVSTGAVYDSAQDLPLTENSRLISRGSPYAQSKVMMEKKAEELRKQGLNCIVARPFNHIGPGQEPGFLVPDLFSKITQSLKNNTPVSVGNLQTKRDYTDVRDVVRAYADLAQAAQLKENTYNVCSSKSVSGEEILKLLSGFMGAEDIRIVVDESLIRKNDPKDLFGSFERLQQETGWGPMIPLEKTIKDFVEAAA